MNEQNRISSTNPIGKINFFLLYLLYIIHSNITILHNFYIWFSTGISHILNWDAYDHVLFLFALCSIYTFRQWKKMLLLITAFTIGHSLTLALSVLHVININTALVEFLIAITIIVTCLHNLKFKEESNTTKRSATYWMAALFGLIHGLGFASVLKEMLSDENILLPLFSFNIGIEVGQLVVVLTLLLIMQLIKNYLRIKQSALYFFISITIAGVAFIVAISRFTDILHY